MAPPLAWINSSTASRGFSREPSHLGDVLRRLILVFLMGWPLALMGPSVASAHSDLESSTPADGQTLTTPPAVVTLIFGEDVQPQFAQVAVTESDGRSVGSGDVAIDGARVDLPVSVTDGGTYVVAYRIVSGDGHPIQGQLSFSYAAPSPTAGTSPRSESSTAAPSATPSEAAAQASPTGSAANEGHNDQLLLIVVGVLGVVVLGIGLRVFRRRG